MNQSPVQPSPRPDRITSGSLIFVAVRCTLQYIVLPFVLPWFGLSGAFSVVISALLEVIALGLIAYNIRRLWSTSWRWRYVSLSAIMILIIGLFLYLDLQALLRA